MSRVCRLASVTVLAVVLVSSAAWSLGPAVLEESALEQVWGGDPVQGQGPMCLSNNVKCTCTADPCSVWTDGFNDWCEVTVVNTASYSDCVPGAAGQNCQAIYPLNPTNPCGTTEEGAIPIRIDMRRQPRAAKGFSLNVRYQDDQGREEETRTTFIVDHKPDIMVSPNPINIQLTPGERRTAQVVVMDYHAKAVPLGEPRVSSSRIKAATVERPTVYLPGWRHAFEVGASAEGLAAGNYRDEIIVKTEDPNQAEIRIEVLLSVAPRIRVAPDPLYLKPSAKGEELSGELYLSDAQGSRIELGGIDVSRQPFTWSAREVSGKKVIALAADRRKIRSSGSVSVTLRITKPCSQLIPIEVRW